MCSKPFGKCAFAAGGRSVNRDNNSLSLLIDAPSFDICAAKLGKLVSIVAHPETVIGCAATMPSVKIKGIDKQDESVSINIEYQNSSDPRKDLFKYAVEKGWSIIGMSVHKRNLEDLFRNLTLDKGSITDA